MDQPRRPAILITGASSGLGAEYVRQLARADQRDILLVARRAERLEALRDEVGVEQAARLHLFPTDLRDLRGRETLATAVKAAGFRVEMLVNNAGFGSLGPFAESDSQWEQDMVEVNCKAPLHLCRAFLGDLLESRGVVINLCSTASFQPMPYMSTYGATKAFLLSFTTALAAELGPDVYFLAQCPGPTRTEFHLVVGLPDKLTYLPSMTAAEVVAAAITRAQQRGPGILVHGWTNAVLAQSNRFLSRTVAARIVARILAGVRA